MAASEIDPRIIRGLIKARDELIFWLTEQNAPQPEQLASLWEAFDLLRNGIEEIKRVSGFEEEVRVIWPPKET